MPVTEELQDARLLVGEGAVITVTRAAELLGFRDASKWLRDENLVSVAVVGKGRKAARVERVVWRQVLARLEQSAQPQDTAPANPARKSYHRMADV